MIFDLLMKNISTFIVLGALLLTLVSACSNGPKAEKKAGKKDKDPGEFFNSPPPLEQKPH